MRENCSTNNYFRYFTSELNLSIFESKILSRMVLAFAKRKNYFQG